MIAGAALVVAIVQSWGQLYPLWRERKERRLLIDRLGRGPYDKATIERSTRYYMRPQCTNVDPSTEPEPRDSLTAPREDLFKKIDDFLQYSRNYRHLIILADSGMGKTSFVLNYYAYNARKRASRRHRIALVPLGLARATELIDALPDKQDTVLFLDALDEDTSAIKDYRARLDQLLALCEPFSKIVVTCRTQFFPRDDEIPSETGMRQIGPRSAGEEGSLRFQRLYLAPFDDATIERYLKRRYPWFRRSVQNRALDIARSVENLSVRPMLLSHIPELVSTSGAFNSASEIYAAMISAWLERETAWVDKDQLNEFSEKLAVEIYSSREQRQMEAVPYEELTRLANDWNIGLHDWQISSRSLLNRDALGNFKFAHRSFMEYLYVRQILDLNPGCMGTMLTDQMMLFLVESLVQLRSDRRIPFLMRSAMKHMSELGVQCWREELNRVSVGEEVLLTRERAAQLWQLTNVRTEQYPLYDVRPFQADVVVNKDRRAAAIAIPVDYRATADMEAMDRMLRRPDAKRYGMIIDFNIGHNDLSDEVSLMVYLSDDKTRELMKDPHPDVVFPSSNKVLEPMLMKLLGEYRESTVFAMAWFVLSSRCTIGINPARSQGTIVVYI
jgi:hypothetical protein